MPETLKGTKMVAAVPHETSIKHDLASNRQQAYWAIDTERDYQMRIWQERAKDAGNEYRPDNTKGVDEWLIYTLGYYHDVIAEASHKPSGGNSLHIVRKLAALCVACMETHGCVFRAESGYVTQEKDRTIPLSREDVYHCISRERHYQDDLPDSRTDERRRATKRSVEGYLCMFYTYLNRAIDGWTNTNNDLLALDNIRKLAAICVHCMEDHGAPYRE